MSTGSPGPEPASRVKASRLYRLMAFGVVIVLILAGVAYVGWITLWPPKTSEPASGEGVAEIENVTGKVSVRLRSNASWEKGKEGMKLYAGDLIQTGSSGVAQLRFLHGPSISVPSDTMFSIRHVEDKAGKSLPPLSLASRPVSLAAEKPAPTPVPEKQKPLPEVPTKVAEPVKQPEPPPKAIPLPEPTLELDRIVPFGRSLELVGRVDPGNKLLVNSEVVRVESDGSFKHFTKPFATSGTVQLVLKTTDLAGRVRTLTRTATIH